VVHIVEDVDNGLVVLVLVLLVLFLMDDTGILVVLRLIEITTLCWFAFGHVLRRPGGANLAGEIRCLALGVLGDALTGRDEEPAQLGEALALLRRLLRRLSLGSQFRHELASLSAGSLEHPLGSLHSEFTEHGNVP
jgi:hypothetical protein